MNLLNVMQHQSHVRNSSNFESRTVSIDGVYSLRPTPNRTKTSGGVANLVANARPNA